MTRSGFTLLLPFAAVLSLFNLPALAAQPVPITAVSASRHDGNVPADTLDNNFDTRWSAAGDGQWIRFDLGSIKKINALAIGFFKGNTRHTRFDLGVSADGKTWSTVFSGQSNGTTLAQETFGFIPVQARYVRYVGHGNDTSDPNVGQWNSLTEVDIYAVAQVPAAPTDLTADAGNARVNLAWSAATGADAYNIKRATVRQGPYSNINSGQAATNFADVGVTNGVSYYYVVAAVNGAGESVNSAPVAATPRDATSEIVVRVVTASSDDGNVPANTIDNDVATRWSAVGDGQWIQFDFGQMTTIGSAKIGFYNGDQRKARFDLAVSADGVSWTVVDRGESSGVTREIEGFDFADVDARYLRYIGHGNSVNDWNSLTEVNLYAPGLVDTTAPSVTLPAPANNTTVQGTVSMEAAAWDDVGVTRVEFLLDGRSLGADVTPPYTYRWDTASASVGNHRLSANAYDAAGRMTSSAIVAVSVARVTPPDPSSCALPAYPTPSCTGVPAGTALTTINGDVTLSTPGQVFENKRVTGSITVAADGVVIRNSEVYGEIGNWNGGNPFRYTVTDSTIGPPSGCNSTSAVGAGRFTAKRLYIRNTSDGFRISHNDVTIEDSFVILCSSPGDHSDGIQGYEAGINNVIRHNTIDQRLAEDSTSNVFMANESKQAELYDNLFMGGGYTIRVHDGGGSRYIVRGNRVVDGSWSYGPSYVSCSVTQWSDNRLVTIDANYKVTALNNEFAPSCD
ncbi:MAG: discoidin domain-containing protein [Gammaproteobacteria bacterium]|nr:discoidin domain-containing protein [Gammaproteobacteria bacterium]